MYDVIQLSCLIRPGDTVLDLACGPGPLLLELAALYPDCRFIGADLSHPMLSALEETSAVRGLRNVETLCDDIRHLASIPDGSVDLIITTSALHHLPDALCLQQVFQRVRNLLKPDGGLYIFDFGLVKSQKTRDLLVADVAKKAPARFKSVVWSTSSISSVRLTERLRPCASLSTWRASASDAA